MSIQSHIQNRIHHARFIAVQDAIHAFLRANGYTSLDLPVLSSELIPEAYLEVFETEYRSASEHKKLYLTPSPELFIKRLLVDGIGDCYYLGRSFRNSEPASPRHFGEFTMLEFYKVNTDYMGLADDVLALLQFISRKIHERTSITYQSVPVSFSQWEKLTVAEAFERYAHMSPDVLFDHKRFCTQVGKKGYRIEENGTFFSYEDLFSQVYSQEVEPHLGMNGYPTLLYDYPRAFASLAKPNADGKTARRFEFYIAGLELGNCYDELADASEQKRRFEEDDKLRHKYGTINHPVDWGFITSLEKGLPDCAGIAVGVERLAMIFADLHDIKQLQLITVT